MKEQNVDDTGVDELKSYRKDYPRPQLVRDGWVNLNGKWDFAFDDENTGEIKGWQNALPAQTVINVPFTYETKMSGIGDETAHENVWYSRKVDVDSAKLTAGRILLHFEGSDFYTRVWVNGALAGSHRGGYARFSLDITKLAKAGENTVVVKVEDSFDEQQPRGKQRWIKDNFDCWYVQTTGIWKTVWMEYLPADAVTAVKLTPILAEDAIEIECDVFGGDGLVLAADIEFGGVPIASATASVWNGHVRTKVDLLSTAVTPRGIKLWSPENPDLYDLTLRLVRDGETVDEVLSYFGMREIRIDGDKILLNGVPLYQRLILDQGYWRDSHLTPPSEEALIEDIDKIHALGYNGLRKHQKTEDERFLYWCDVKGMLVWSEMPSTYVFSDYAVQEFTSEWMEIVRQNYSHPCIITWTPFNESWGILQVKTEQKQQHFTEAIYYLTKAFDSMRPVIVNDGWEHTISDILTLHDYEESGRIFFERYSKYKDDILSNKVYHSRFKSALADGYAYRGQPVLISEFGGIAFDDSGSADSPAEERRTASGVTFTDDDSGWGYGNKVKGEEAFIKRFDDITTAIKELPYVCGFCYTQVSDVQQEINGLMDIDRNFKVAPEKIREINERQISICYMP